MLLAAYFVVLLRELVQKIVFLSPECVVQVFRKRSADLSGFTTSIVQQAEICRKVNICFYDKGVATRLDRLIFFLTSP